MKRFVFCALVTMLCAVTSICGAFELDRSQWINYFSDNHLETFYNESSIQRDGNTGKVWICQHYRSSDMYRLICKEYTRGSNKARILKRLDYYSDGTFKQGSSMVISDVGLGTNEEVVVQKLW